MSSCMCFIQESSKDYLLIHFVIQMKKMFLFCIFTQFILYRMHDMHDFVDDNVLLHCDVKLSFRTKGSSAC